MDYVSSGVRHSIIRRDNVRAAIGRALGLVIRLAWRVASPGSSNFAARMRLGQIYLLLRSSAHELEAKRYRTKYGIGPQARWGLNTIFTGEGSISMGEGSYIGRDSFVVAHPREARIMIGKGCAISHSVHIRPGGLSTKTHLKEALTGDPIWSDVTIGDYVWIGAHVVITGGVN